MPQPIQPKIIPWLLNQVTFESNRTPQIQISSGQSLALWGFQGGRLHRESLALDTLTFQRAVAAAFLTPEIPYGGLVSLVDPTGVTRFVGRRIYVPSSATGNAESQEWLFGGPWFWLQRLTYKQTWEQLLVSGALVPRDTSHLLLNIGARQTIGAQITHVLEFAIDQGAPFQIGTVDIPIVPFVTEITDQTCAQVIIDQLRFAPDAVAWFDYSTNPPTFHCRQSSDLSVFTYNFGPNGNPPIADGGLQITARPDLQVESVALRYERTDTLNGNEYLSLGEDIYPVGSGGDGLNAINATIPLAGFSRTTVTGSVLCETIDTASLAWWKRVCPSLQDRNIRNLALVAGTVQRVLQGSRTDSLPNGTPSSGFARFLVEGQLVDWMRDATDNALDWEQEEISAEFTYDLDVDPSSNVRLQKVTRHRIPVQLVSTTAPAGVSTYEDEDTEEEGELQPVGLAQYLYNSLNPLEYEGAVETTQRECTGFIGPGNTLSITGTGIAAHALMSARVQSVEELIDTGQTMVRFGSTPALSLSAILDFMHASRHRRRWTRSSVQEDGESPNSGNVQLGEATANNNTITGEKQRSLFAVHHGTSAAGNRVELDANASGGVMTVTLKNLAVTAVDLIGRVTSTIAQWLARSGTGTALLKAESSQAECTVVGSGGQIQCKTSLCNGKTLYPREEVWCHPTTGARMKIMVLSSDPYP